MNQDLPTSGNFIEFDEIQMRAIGLAIQQGSLKLRDAIKKFHTSWKTINSRLSALIPPIQLDLTEGRPQLQLEESLVQKVVDYRNNTKVGYQQCAFALNLSEWLVRTIYELKGLFIFEQEFLNTEEEHPNLFVAKYVGQLWHTDIHYIKYNEGDEVKTAYLIAFIDDRSRYIIHHEILDTKDSNSAAQSLIHALEKARKPHTITIDNGGEFIGKSFQDVLKNFNIIDHRTHPYTPQENGKIERWWLTLETHLTSLDNLDFIVGEYNNKWMHRGLFKLFKKKLTPSSVYNSEERWEGHTDLIMIYLNN